MYEIPVALKSLYAHWQEHTVVPRKTQQQIKLDAHILSQIDKFIAERMHIWHKRQTMPSQKSYTNDQILSQYRFCNIYRELDRQTIDIHTQLKPLTNNFSLWLLNVAFHRFVCNPQTVANVGLLSFDEKKNKLVHNKLLDHARPKYGVAYIFPISTIQRSSTPTRELFFTQHLPRVMPKIAALLQTKKKASVCDLLKEILPLFEFNLSFHWTEILIDVAYQYPQLVDLYKEFPIGPGSVPTMKRLSLDANADPQQIPLQLIHHNPKDFPYLTLNGKPVFLSAENWEGVGCEFRKYTNLEAGNGRRRIYSRKKIKIRKIKK